MRFYTTKDCSFSASHQLTSLPADHQCSRLHGHNYKVTITMSAAKLDNNGFVVDFGEMKTLVNYFDHRHLNDLIKGPTTVEHLCGVIWDMLEATFVKEDPAGDLKVEEVKIHETETCFCVLKR